MFSKWLIKVKKTNNQQGEIGLAEPSISLAMHIQLHPQDSRWALARCCYAQ